MSQDIKIQNKCDHYINWEKGVLQKDKKSILIGYPIASTLSTELRINDVIRKKTDFIVVTSRKDYSLETYFYIVMKNKIKDYRPLIEVKYTTDVLHCPKCLGVKVLDDLVYKQDGDILLVEKEYLLLQLVEKYIITRVGSNVYHNWMGTGIIDLVGTSIIDIDVIRNRILNQVNSGIEKLRNVQRQLQSTRREMTPGELFGELISVEVEQAEDPTILLVTVVFTAQSGKSLEFSQYVELTNIRERRSAV